MTPTGFEQVAKTREKQHFSDDPKHNPKQLAHNDPLLADLIELWPTLDEATKGRILRLAVDVNDTLPTLSTSTEIDISAVAANCVGATSDERSECDEESRKRVARNPTPH